MTTTIECSNNKAYSVSKYEYEGHSYLSITRMYKKRGDTEWSRGKGVAFQIDTSNDIDVISRVIGGVKNFLVSSSKLC